MESSVCRSSGRLTMFYFATFAHGLLAGLLDRCSQLRICCKRRKKGSQRYIGSCGCGSVRKRFGTAAHAVDWTAAVGTAVDFPFDEARTRCLPCVQLTPFDFEVDCKSERVEVDGTFGDGHTELPSRLYLPGLGLEWVLSNCSSSKITLIFECNLLAKPWSICDV
jgi:hypothetical protein